MKQLNYIGFFATVTMLVLVGCQAAKRVPNYDYSRGTIQIWRYTKKGEPTKDILSNGDTLVTTSFGMYIIPPVQSKTL